MPLQVIPVLDVQAGRAVRAVGGDRAHYRPLQSVLHEGSDPVSLAKAYHDRLGFTTLYLADLDAITGGVADLGLYSRIRSAGVALWVDAGTRRARDVDPLREAGVASVVVGLETIAGAGEVGRIVAGLGPEGVVFSLDLREGEPLVPPGAEWRSRDPYGIAEEAIGVGVRRILVLDLAAIGKGEGLRTLALVERLAAAYPGLFLVVGGGVAGRSDFGAIEDAGASAVLVGSALHDGRIGRADLPGGKD